MSFLKNNGMNVKEYVYDFAVDGGATGESALRFRIHVCMVDISRNPTESATVSTGT